MDALGNTGMLDDAEGFGFRAAAPARTEREEKVQHDDEDEFAVDEELVASDSDIEDVELSDSDMSEADSEAGNESILQAQAHQDDEESVTPPRLKHKTAKNVMMWLSEKRKHVQFLRSFYEARDQMKYQEDIEKVE